LNSPIENDWSPKRAAFDKVQPACPAALEQAWLYLEQAWLYDDSIAGVSDNEIHLAIITADGGSVATLQTAEPRLLVRLTRGPITVHADLLPEIAKAVRADYPRLSRNLLFWMPDIIGGAATMRPICKRQMTPGYSSTSSLIPTPCAQTFSGTGAMHCHRRKRTRPKSATTAASARLRISSPTISKIAEHRNTAGRQAFSCGQLPIRSKKTRFCFRRSIMAT
jgi:hypothetical protein